MTTLETGPGPVSESRPDLSVIGRLHRNAVKQRLFRRFVRNSGSPKQGSLKRTADIYFLVHYAGMSRKRAAEVFGVSQERVRQIVNKGDKLIELNQFQVCHPRGSCVIGAINT
jgi:hypothetical protein